MVHGIVHNTAVAPLYKGGTVHHVYSNTVYIFEHNALNKPQVAAKI